VLEARVEAELKVLERTGFKCLKLRTPGTSGVPDRMILWPKWSPAPSVYVELKQPGKSERGLQAWIRDDWRARGCDVRDMCDTIEKVRHLCRTLLWEAEQRAPAVKLPWVRMREKPTCSTEKST
jgi:hypothetical protein